MHSCAVDLISASLLSTVRGLTVVSIICFDTETLMAFTMHLLGYVPLLLLFLGYFLSRIETAL